MQDTGIITFSVCNVHQAEDSSSEMLTQGLLGMKAIILERRKWIKIKLENDENEGWVHPRAIASLASDEQWTNSSKIIITAHYGFSYTQPDIILNAFQILSPEIAYDFSKKQMLFIK